MKNISLFFLLLIYCKLSLALDTPWQRHIINYTRKDYNAAAQNWMIKQSNKGWIYSANSEGLLEFDGIHWNLHKIKNKVLRSIHIANEIIYAGGDSEFGYFKPNKKGELTYTSLINNFPEWGDSLWNILEYNSKIYYISDWDIFILNPNDNTISRINSNHKITSSCFYNSRLIIGTSNGIAQILNNKIEYIDNFPANYKIIDLIESDNELLVITSMNGIYRLYDNKLQKVLLKDSHLLLESQLYCAKKVNHILILGSVQNGAIFIDLDRSTIIEQINIKNGLRTNTILSIYVDNRNNVWFALDNGISFVEINSPINPLFSNNSPIGSGYCSYLYKNKLYLGTNQGIYAYSDNSFSLLNRSAGQIWSFNEINNELFCSGDNGIMIISNTNISTIDLSGTWETHSIENDKTILATQYSGITVLKKDNKQNWNPYCKIDIVGSMRNIIVSEEEKQISLFFIRGDKIIKALLDKKNFKIIQEKEYLLPDNFILENKYLSLIEGKIIAPTENGIYAYDNISDSFNKYKLLEEKLDGNVPYNLISQDNQHNIWYRSDKSLKVLLSTNLGYAKQGKTKGLIIDELTNSPNCIYLTDSTNVIIGTENGFSKLNLNYNDTTNKTRIETYIKNIVDIKNDTVIHNGYSSDIININYKNNSIRIEYSTSLLSTMTNTLFSYRLNNSAWSKPEQRNFKEFTNLDVGNYDFQVIAIDEINDSKSAVASIKLKISPPWYRSSLSYLVYSIILLLIVYYTYKKTIKRQQSIIHSQQLENNRKDDEIYKLQNKNLKTELEFKTQELSGSILNIVRKNEVLENLKTKLLHVIQVIDKKASHTELKKQIKQLIKDVDRNIDKDSDFAVFQSNFNILHQDFFDELEKEIPNITKGEKILCAYLNMNLSTKEIAQLLNISVRGVEINRYRIRKKIGLSRDENLIDYIKIIKRRTENGLMK